MAHVGQRRRLQATGLECFIARSGRFGLHVPYAGDGRQDTRASYKSASLVPHWLGAEANPAPLLYRCDNDKFAHEGAGSPSGPLGGHSFPIFWVNNILPPVPQALLKSQTRDFLPASVHVKTMAKAIAVESANRQHITQQMKAFFAMGWGLSAGRRWRWRC